jgi:hypothetical protein
MPRWLVALILVVFGIVGVYRGVTDPCIHDRLLDKSYHGAHNRFHGKQSSPFLWFSG